MALILRGRIQILLLQSCVPVCFCLHGWNKTRTSFRYKLTLYLRGTLKQPKMSTAWLGVFAFLFVSSCFAHEPAEQDRDHLSVGIMIKPEHCPRETKDGDVLSVRFNNTLIDQTPVLPTR